MSDLRDIVNIFFKIIGVFCLLGGIYGILVSYRVLPRNPKKQEKLEAWHRDYGKQMKILAPLMILVALLFLSGLLV